jgi:hypothetical protein
MPTPMRRFYRRHGTLIVVVVVATCLALLAGYDAAVHRQERLRTQATCTQIQTLYDTIIALVKVNAEATGAFSPATVARLRRQEAERISACRRAP